MPLYALKLFAAGIVIPLIAALNAGFGKHIGAPIVAGVVLFGVGIAVMFVLLGQLVSAAAIDHFGLFGAQVASLTLTRTAGIFLMAAGVVLAQRG